MTLQEALEILLEFNKWRRAQGEYAWNEDPAKNKPYPFKPDQIGEAIDVACTILDKAVNLK